MSVCDVSFNKYDVYADMYRLVTKRTKQRVVEDV